MAGDGGIQSKYLVNVTTNGLNELKDLLLALQSVRDLATAEQRYGATVVFEADTSGLEGGVKKVSQLTKKEMQRAGQEGQKEVERVMGGGRGRGSPKDFSFRVVGGLKPGDVKELRAAITALTIAVDQLPKKIGATGGRGPRGDLDVTDAIATSIRTRPTVTKTAARDSKKELQKIIDRAIEKRASKEKSANQQAKTAAGKLGITDNELEGLIGGGLNISSLTVGGSNTQSRNVEQAALKARLARARAAEAKELKKNFDPTVKSLDYFDDKLLNQLIDEAGVRTAFYSKGNNKTKTVKTSNRGLPRYQQSVITPPAATPSSVSDVGGLDALGRAESTLSKLGNLLQANVLEPLTNLANIGKELGTAAQELQALRDLVKDETEGVIRGSGDAGVRAGVIGPRTYGERRGPSRRPLGRSNGLEVRGAVADFLIDSGIGRDDETLKNRAQKIARLTYESEQQQLAAKGALLDPKFQNPSAGEFLRTQANRGVVLIDAAKFQKLTNKVDNVQKLLFEDARDERGRIAIQAGAPYNDSGIGRGSVRPDALKNLAGTIDQVGRLRFQEDALNNLIRGALDELSGLEVSARKAIKFQKGDTSGFADLPQRAQTFLKLFKTLRTQFDAVRAERRKIDPSERPSTSALDATEMIAVLNQIGLPQIAKQVDVNFGNQDYEQVARGFKPTADLVTALTSGDDAVVSQTFKKLFSSRGKRSISAQRYVALRSGGTREVLENLGKRVSSVGDLADAKSGNENARDRARSRGVDPAMAQQIVGLADYQLRYLTKVAKEAIDILRPLDQLNSSGQPQGVKYAGESGGITDKREALLKAIRAGGGTKSGAPSALVKAIGDLRRQGAAGFYDNEPLGDKLGRVRTLLREIEPLQKLLQEVNVRRESGGEAAEGVLPLLERGGFTTGTTEQRIKQLRDRLGGKTGELAGPLGDLRALASSAAGVQGGATALRGDVDQPDQAILRQYQQLVEKNPLFKTLFHSEGTSVKSLREQLKRFQEVVKEFELLDKILLGLRNKEPRNFGKIQELAFDIKEFVKASQAIDVARKGDPGVLDPTDKKKKRYQIGREPRPPVQGEAAQLVPVRVPKPELARLERDILVSNPQDRPRLQSQLERARSDKDNYYQQGAGEYIRHLLTDKTLPLERLFGTGGDHAKTAIDEIVSLVERIDPNAAKILRRESAGFGPGGVTGPGAGIYREPGSTEKAGGGLIDVSGIASLKDLDLHNLVAQFGQMAGFAAQISTGFRGLRGLDAFLKVLNKEQLTKFRGEMRKMVKDAIDELPGSEARRARLQQLRTKFGRTESRPQTEQEREVIRQRTEAADVRAQNRKQALRDRLDATRALELPGEQQQLRLQQLRDKFGRSGYVANAPSNNLTSFLARSATYSRLVRGELSQPPEEFPAGQVTPESLPFRRQSARDRLVGRKGSYTQFDRSGRPRSYQEEVRAEIARQAELRYYRDLEEAARERQAEERASRPNPEVIPIPNSITSTGGSGKSGGNKTVRQLLEESERRRRVRADIKNMLDNSRAEDAALGSTDALRGTPAPLRSSVYRDAALEYQAFQQKTAGFTRVQRYLTGERDKFDALPPPDQQAIIRTAYAKYKFSPEEQKLEESRIKSDLFLDRATGRRTSPDRRQVSLPVDVERRGGERRGVDESYDRFIQQAQREALKKSERRRREEDTRLKRAEKITRDQAFAGFTPQEQRDSATRGTLDKYLNGRSAAGLYAEGGLFHRAIQEATVQIQDTRKRKAEDDEREAARKSRKGFFDSLNPTQRKFQLGREKEDRTLGTLPPGVSIGQAYAQGLVPNFNDSVALAGQEALEEKARKEQQKARTREKALREVRQERARREMDRLAAAVPSTILENNDPIELLQVLGKELKSTARLQLRTQEARTGVALAGSIGGSTLEQAQRGLGRASFGLARNYAFTDDLVRTGIDTIPGFERFRPDADQLSQVNRRRRFVEGRLNSYTEQEALAQAPGLPPEERAKAQRNAEREMSALRRAGIKDINDAKNKLKELTEVEEKHRQVLRKGVADTLTRMKAEEERLGVLDTLLDKVRQVALYAGAGFFVYGLIQGFRQTVQEAIALEAAVTRVQAVLGKGGGEVRSRITSDIFRASRDFGAKPQAGAQAYQVFAQAGLEGDELTRAVRASLSAEVGAGLEPQQAQELLIAVHSLTDGAITFENIIDRISRIEAKYAVSAQDLAVAIQRVGSLAQQLQPNPVGRIDFADVVTAATTQIVELTRVTGNQAATSLRFIFARLLAPDTSKKLNNNFGISLYSDPAGKNIRPLLDILADISKLYRNLNEPGPGQSTAKANQLLQVVAGARQINAAAALFSDFGKVMKIARESAESFGTAQARTALQMETLEKRMAQLNASFSSLTAGIFRSTGIEGASKLGVSLANKGLGAAAENPLLGTAAAVGGLFVAGKVLPRLLVGISTFLGVVSGQGIAGPLGELSNPAFTKFASRIGIFAKAFAKLSLVLTIFQALSEILDNLPFGLEFAGLQNKQRRQFGFGKLPFDKAKDSEEFQAFESVASGFVRSNTTIGRDRVGEFSGTPFTANSLQAEVLRRAAKIESRFRSQGLGKFFPTAEEEEDLTKRGLKPDTRRDLRDAIGKDLVIELRDAGIDLRTFGGQVRSEAEQTAEAFKILRDALKFANFAPSFRSEQLATQTDEDLKKAQESAQKSIQKGSGFLYEVRNLFGNQATDKLSLKDFQVGVAPARAFGNTSGVFGSPPAQSVAQEILRSITGGYGTALDNLKLPNQFGKGTATFLEQAAEVVKQGAEEFAKGAKTAGDAFDAVTYRNFILSKEEAQRLNKIRDQIAVEEQKSKRRRTGDQIESEIDRRLAAGGDTRAVQIRANERALDEEIRSAYRSRFDVKGREGAITGDLKELLGQTEGGRITADKIFERVQAVSSQEIQKLARQAGLDAAAGSRLAQRAEDADNQQAFRTAYDPTGGRRAARSRLVELLGQFQVSQTEIEGLGGPKGAFTRAGVQYDALRERQASAEALTRGLTRVIPEVQLDLARTLTQIPAKYLDKLTPQQDESFLAGLDETQRNLLLQDQAGREAGFGRELAAGVDPKTIENLKAQAASIQAQLVLLKSNDNVLQTLPRAQREFVLGADKPITNDTLGAFLVGIQALTASLPQLQEASINLLEAARTAVREREQRAIFLGQDVAQDSRLTDLTVQGRATLRTGQQRFSDLRGPQSSLGQALRGLISEEQELRLRERTRLGGERLKIEGDETITNEADRTARLEANSREQLQSELYITEQVEARRKEILQATYLDLLTQQEQSLQSALAQGTSGFREVFKTFRGAFPSKDGSGINEDSLLSRLFLPAADQLTSSAAESLNDSLFGQGGLLEKQARGLFEKPEETRYANLLQSAHEIGIRNGAEYLITAIEQAFAGLSPAGNYDLIEGDPTKPNPAAQRKLEQLLSSPVMDTLYSITGRPKGGIVLGPDSTRIGGIFGDKAAVAGLYDDRKDRVQLSSLGLAQDDRDVRDTITHELGHRLSFKDPQLSVDFRRHLQSLGQEVDDYTYGANFEELFARAFAEARSRLDDTRKVAPGEAKQAYKTLTIDTPGLYKDDLTGEPVFGANQTPGVKFFADYLLNRPEYAKHPLRQYSKFAPDGRPYGFAPIDMDIATSEAVDEPVFRRIAQLTGAGNKKGSMLDSATNWFRQFFDMIDPKDPVLRGAVNTGNQVAGGRGLDLGTDLMLQSLGYSPYRENRAALGNRVQSTGGTVDNQYILDLLRVGQSGGSTTGKTARKGLFKNAKLNQLLGSAADLGGSYLGTLAGGKNTGSTVGSSFGSQIGSTLTTEVFSSAFSFLGGAAGPVGAIAGGLLGGLIGGLFGGKKKGPPPELTALEQIERNTKETYTAISNQGGNLFGLENRLINVPTSFTVPSYRPVSSGSGASTGDIIGGVGPSITVQQTVQVTIQDARDPDAVAKAVDRQLKNELRRGGTYVNKRY